MPETLLVTSDGYGQYSSAGNSAF